MAIQLMDRMVRPIPRMATQPMAQTAVHTANMEIRHIPLTGQRIASMEIRLMDLMVAPIASMEILYMGPTAQVVLTTVAPPTAINFKVT